MDDTQNKGDAQQQQPPPPPQQQDDSTNPLSSSAAAAGLRHRAHHHLLVDDDQRSMDSATAPRRLHHQLEEPLIMLQQRDARDDATTTLQQQQQQQHQQEHQDPLLLLEQPPHRREHTVTNIAEVYRLVLDSARSVAQTVAAARGDDDDDAANYYDSLNMTATPSSTSVAAIRAGAVANLCSATLGAGVLALPYALQQAGLVVGGLLLAVSALATVSSIALLVRAADRYRPHRTYEALAEHVIGPRCRSAVEGALLLFCGGCAVAYTIAVGDILVQADLLLWNSRHWSTVAAFLAFMLPLSLLRTMRSLQFASSVGIAAIGTLAFAAFVHCLSDHQREEQNNDDDDDAAVHLRDFLWPAHGAVSVMTAAPVVLFAFSCQTNVCAIYEELVVPEDAVTATSNASNGNNNNNNNNNSNALLLTKAALMRQVTVTAVLLCALLYSTVSTIALADFGDAVLPNMLSNYHGEHSGGGGGVQIMQVATAAMAFAVVMAFPLNIFPARVTLIGLIEKQRQQQRILLPAAAAASSAIVRPAADDEENLTEALLPSSSGGGNDNEFDSVAQAADATGGAAKRESEQEHHMMAPLQVQQVPGTTNPSAEDEANRQDDDDDEGGGDDEHFNWQLHVATTLFLTGTALGFALVVPNISVVFGLLGGTASSMIGFCVPGLLGIQLCRDVHAETGDRQLPTLVVSWLLLAGGVLAGIVTTGVTAYNLIWA